jgi:hypothetical protein
MDWLKIRTNIFEKGLGIFGIGMGNKLQKRIDKNRPE